MELDCWTCYYDLKSYDRAYRDGFGKKANNKN